MKKLKKIPKLKSALQENDFWQSNDSVQYIDWTKAKIATFPNLKPSKETISLRLPTNLLNEIKTLANKEDVPYQSFMKMLLSQAIHNIRK